MATFDKAKEVKRKHSLRLLNMPEVCGVDVQTDAHGEGLICVHVDRTNPSGEEDIPSVLEDVPVKVFCTGPFQKQS